MVLWKKVWHSVYVEILWFICEIFTLGKRGITPSALVEAQRSVTCVFARFGHGFSSFLPQNRMFETPNCQKWSEAQPEALTRQTHMFRDIWISFTNCLKSILSKQQVFNYNQNQFFTKTLFNNNNFIHNSYPNLDMRLSTTINKNHNL